MGIIFTEGSGLNDSVFGKSQAPIKMFLEKRGEQFEQQSVLKDLFSVNPSSRFGEKITSMTAMNGFAPVGENGAYPSDEMQEGYSKFLENMTWKDSFALSQEAIEDSVLMNLRQRPAQFISSYYRTREKYGAALYAGAVQGQTAMQFSGRAFDLTGADGLCLFHTTHPAKVKGDAQGNLFSDAFTDDALGALECRMQNFRGDNDEILDVAPDTIVIPNDHTLKKLVFAAIGADKDPDTANNGFNYLYGRWRVIVNPYLNQYLAAGIKPWILLDSKYNATYGGAVWFDRLALSVRSTLDENTDANVWRGRARFIAGFNDWRFAAAGGIAAGSAL